MTHGSYPNGSPIDDDLGEHRLQQTIIAAFKIRSHRTAVQYKNIRPDLGQQELKRRHVPIRLTKAMFRGRGKTVQIGLQNPCRLGGFHKPFDPLPSDAYRVRVTSLQLAALALPKTLIADQPSSFIEAHIITPELPQGHLRSRVDAEKESTAIVRVPRAYERPQPIVSTHEMLKMYSELP
jgi:hypothetical protein